MNNNLSKIIISWSTNESEQVPEITAEIRPDKNREVSSGEIISVLTSLLVNMCDENETNPLPYMLMALSQKDRSFVVEDIKD